MQPLGFFIAVSAYVLVAAILIRIIFSWTNFDPENPIAQVIQQITEPILQPLRQIIPRMGMMDISSLVAIVLLSVIASMVAGIGI